MARFVLVFPFLLAACATDSSDLGASDPGRQSYTPIGHPALFRVDCTDEICDTVVAVPLELPEGVPAQWNLNGETFPIEPEAAPLELSLESGELADLTLEVEYEGDLWTDQQFIARSDVVDEERQVMGTGYHIIGGVDPAFANVVTYDACDDRKVKVTIIGGCFMARQPFDVLISPPRFSAPTHASHYGDPARYTPSPVDLDLGDWVGGRVVLNQGEAYADGANWPMLSTGDRLELAVPLAVLDQYMLIRTRTQMHENPIGVRCENNSIKVRLTDVRDPRAFIGG